MNDQQYWVPILRAALIPIAIVLVMSWLRRSRDRANVDNQSNQLRHPTSTLVLASVLSGTILAVAAIAAYADLRRGAQPPFWGVVFVSGLSLLGLPLFLDYRNARHTLLPDGLQFGRMMGGGGVLRWKDIRTIKYSSTSKWFVLITHDGTVARISAMLIGLPAFAEALLKNVPYEAFEGNARAVVIATAEGNPPSLFA